MADVTPTDDSCGCCRPDAKTNDDLVSELLARRQAVEERLARLEPVGANR